MRSAVCVVLAVFTVSSAPAQMSADQKWLDFQHLASLYAKHYAPYEWKREALGFDALDLTAWRDRVTKPRDDLEFFQVCQEYVARLNDGHAGYYPPTTFSADLGIQQDLYDGKVLIDGINRTLLPVSDYPLQTGDEVVSVDGQTPEEFMREGMKLFAAGNTRTTRRYLANYLSSRPQLVFPRAVELPETATVVIRRQNGELRTYFIPWRKTGKEIRFVGPVPMPKAASTARHAEAEPSYLQVLSSWRSLKAPDRPMSVALGSRNPAFAMPAGFRPRLGDSSSDAFYSGTYEAEGLRIGFLRIPNFVAGTSQIAQFQGEIDFFRQNTDGLIVDVMNNGGGDACLAEQLLARVIPMPFRSLRHQIRATRAWIADIDSALASAQASRAETWVIDLLSAIRKDILTAYGESRAMTGPLPLCGPSADLDPARDSAGNVAAYHKPLMVLVNEFSGSAADMFPAVIQDNQRGPILGARTWGLGGVTRSYRAGMYSEGSADVTVSLLVRNQPVASGEFPTAPYIENIGVLPDIPGELMTKENLLNQGRPFVAEFTAAMVEHIRGSR